MISLLGTVEIEKKSALFGEEGLKAKTQVKMAKRKSRFWLENLELGCNLPQTFLAAHLRAS